MNIFPPLQFHSNDIEKYGEKCVDALIESAREQNKHFFYNWMLNHLCIIHAGAKRMIALNFPVTYQNEEKLSNEKKEELKRYKVRYINKRIKFLEEYKRLIKKNAKEDDIIDLLLEHEVAGFNGMRKLNEEEKWLKKELKGE